MVGARRRGWGVGRSRGAGRAPMPRRSPHAVRRGAAGQRAAARRPQAAPVAPPHWGGARAQRGREWRGASVRPGHQPDGPPAPHLKFRGLYRAFPTHYRAHRPQPPPSHPQTSGSHGKPGPPAPRPAMERVDARTRGLQEGATALVTAHATDPRADIAAERRRASFAVPPLTYLLNGGKEKVERRCGGDVGRAEGPAAAREAAAGVWRAVQRRGARRASARCAAAAPRRSPVPPPARPAPAARLQRHRAHDSTPIRSGGAPPAWGPRPPSLHPPPHPTLGPSSRACWSRPPGLTSRACE
jgi:hypothetical protein